MERRKPDELENFANATKQCECTFLKQKAEYVGNDTQGAAAAAAAAAAWYPLCWLGGFSFKLPKLKNTQMTVALVEWKIRLAVNRISVE